MSSDPRRACLVALLIAAICLPWFAALAVADDALAERFGMNRHAITFLAGTVALCALVAALVFARLAAVRDELLAGRRVIGRWSVDAATWAAFAPTALADDAADRRTALAVVLFFVVVCFGGFALADPEAAPAMASVGGIVAVAMIAAFAFGRRTQAAQWRRRTGEVIVGERGLLRDGVLHVWAVPLSRLIGARMQERPLGLVVTYGWWSRAGRQEVAVALPVARAGARGGGPPPRDRRRLSPPPAGATVSRRSENLSGAAAERRGDGSKKREETHENRSHDLDRRPDRRLRRHGGGAIASR